MVKKKFNKLYIQIPLTLPILFLGLDPNLFSASEVHYTQVDKSQLALI